MLTLTRMIQQGQTIGIIGGGQLGQMMALDAKYTGMKVIVLDPTPACPAGQVADEQIVAEYADVKAIEELARRSDVLTYEFENVDLNALRDVADRVERRLCVVLLDATLEQHGALFFFNPSADLGDGHVLAVHPVAGRSPPDRTHAAPFGTAERLHEDLLINVEPSLQEMLQ